MRTIPDAQIMLKPGDRPTDEKYLLQMEGQCKINSLQALKFSYVRTVPVIIISILTIIPCIILLNFKKARKCLFYSACDFGEADNLYVEMEDGSYDLVSIEDNDNGDRVFVFKQLRYKLSGSQHIPLVLDYERYLQSVNTQNIIKKGLNQSEQTKNQKIYGKNIHDIEIQNYFHYMFSIIFQPLYILQYVVVCSLAIQGLPLFGIILVIASLITTSGNYISMYIGKLKIRKMAQKSINMKVVREGRQIELESSELVPGDIIVFNGQSDIPCDCVVMSGEMFVNQCSLTGENIPIKKTAYRGNIKNTQNWLYDGTKVLEARQAKVMVILTGFASRKGRLLRKILNRVPTQPDFFNKMFFFLIQSFVIGMSLYGATLPIRLSAQIDKAIVVLRILDYLVSSVPPAFPIYFTIAYSWSLYRLKNKEIFSTMPQKTVQSNRLKTACFDKTGTLTLNNLNLKQFYHISKNGINLLDITGKSSEVNFVKLLFGTCHSVRKINGEYQGDQVDLKLWYSSGFKLSKDQLDILENQNKQAYKILVLHQFESRFQSMSVLVREEKTGKHYVIVKGAPEKIQSVSTNKIGGYSNFISDMSFRGLRTIAFGYKIITQAQAKSLITKQRQEFLSNIELVGVAAFENALKPQTVETINELHQAYISTRMITGDNIYIAVEIGFQSGILSPSQPIILLEGKKFQMKGNQKIYNVLEVRKRIDETEKIQRKCTISSIQSNNYLLAVDNDFVSSPEFRITDKMRIFARILPDKKALIVQNIKQEFEQQYGALPWYVRYFREGRHKVAMTGDGANDLMAIKEADVGIGINGTDAVYSSAFTINNLVKQGKCTTLNILQCLRFTLIANYINLVVQILLATQATFISQTQGLYINFLMIILVPIVMSLAQPPQKLYPKKVRDNFLCWQNQLSVWLTLLILSGGLVGSYFFVTTQPSFIYNPKPQWKVGVGYNFQCQLVTLVFLGQGLILATLGWVVSQSLPFKNYFFTSKVLTVVTVLNFVSFTVYFFILYPSGLGFLNFLPIQPSVTGIEYAILMSSIIAAAIFNLLLHKLTNKTQLEELNRNSALTTTNNTTFEIELFKKDDTTMNQALEG